MELHVPCPSAIPSLFMNLITIILTPSLWIYFRYGLWGIY